MLSSRLVISDLSTGVALILIGVFVAAVFGGTCVTISTDLIGPSIAAMIAGGPLVLWGALVIRRGLRGGPKKK